MLIIVSLDLIWVDKIFTDRVRKWINSKHYSYQIHLLIVATHSHSTPQISKKNLNSARPDLSYLDFLYNKVCKAINNAIDNKDSCYVELSITRPNLTVNRRKKVLSPGLLKHGIFKNIVKNRPNYSGPCDDSLYSVWFYNAKGSEKAVILNYACHPTLFRHDAVSADFPGAVAGYLKNGLSEDLVVCFLQGFAGNIKADLTKSSCSNYKNPFSYIYNCLFDRVQFNKKISQQELDHFSAKLAQSSLERVNRERIKPQLFFSSKVVKLPLQNGISAQYVNLEISYVSIGDKLKIVALGGEIFTEYSIWLRNILPSDEVSFLTVGYCNDMAGYVPTYEAIHEGGYEVERAFTEFSYPSPFSDKIEGIVKKGIIELIEMDKA